MELPLLSSKCFAVSLEFMVTRDAAAQPQLPPPFTPRLLDCMLAYLEANAMSTRCAHTQRTQLCASVSRDTPCAVGRDLFIQRGDPGEVQASSALLLLRQSWRVTATAHMLCACVCRR